MSQACKLMGYSRDTFYRFRELYDTGGELDLQEICRKKPVIKNRIKEAVVKIATDNPTLGQLRVANELKKEGLFISPAGVRCVFLRNSAKAGLCDHL